MGWGGGGGVAHVQRCVHPHVIMSLCLNSMRARMTNDAFHTLHPPVDSLPGRGCVCDVCLGALSVGECACAFGSIVIIV